MANFSLPPIKDASPNVPSLSKEELSALPSTSLIALSNNMAVVKSEASVKANQLKARAKKLSGDASIDIPGTIGPVASTTGLMNESSAVGADILKNATAAGTTELDAASIASKLGSFNTEIL